MEFPHRNIKYMIFNFPEKRTIYFRVPKAASTSLLMTFRQMYDVDKVEDYDHSKFKFTFVRNPFDRLASCYRHVIQKGVFQKIQGDERLCRDMTFENFVNVVADTEIKNMDIHFRPQHTFIPETPDFVGKFENLDKDYKELCEKLNIKELELLHENKTSNTNYKDYYTDDIIDKVVEIYKKDFEQFGYSKHLNIT